MKHFMLGLALLSLAGAAVADEKPAYLVPQAAPAGLTKIFDNLARKYPLGLYNRMAGDLIVGSASNAVSPTIALAAGFTPTGNRVVKRIQVALHVIAGTNSAQIGLYSDNAGVPGAALKLWNVHNLSQNGGCCALAAVNSNAGIAVTGGQHYWVVVKTAPGSDFIGTWSFNTTDQVSFVPLATYCVDRPGIPCQSQPSGQWTSSDSAPGRAFAVYGE